MAMQRTVLLVGGTGRTGGRVLRQLLDRGVAVRAIVRSEGKLPPEIAGRPGLTVIEASLLELDDEALRGHLRGCDAVVSCLGHVMSLKGILGPPRDLVTRAAARLCRGIEALRPPVRVRFILMSSVSVNRPGGRDGCRTRFERAILAALCVVLPPARDNQRAADFLHREIGAANAFVEWVAVRPDTLLDGEVSLYALHEELVDALFKPGHTRMANVAHFMCELATDAGTWAAWRGKMPVITDGGEAGALAR